MSDLGDAVALQTAAFTASRDTGDDGMPNLASLVLEYSATPVESMDPAAMIGLIWGLLQVGTDLMTRLQSTGEDPLAALQELALRGERD